MAELRAWEYIRLIEPHARTMDDFSSPEEPAFFPDLILETAERFSAGGDNVNGSLVGNLHIWFH